MATTVSLKPNAVELSGSTSGTTTLQATAVAGTTTITLPAATDTLVGKATTDTLTNKTLTTPVISSLSSASATALTLQSAGTTAVTIDTSQNATFAKSIILSGSTSGTTTLASTAVAGTSTATFPAATGTVMVSGNMPAFSIYLSGSTQSISSGAFTKVSFDTTTFDTNSCISSGRFTPNVAGYYQLNTNILFNSIAVTTIIIVAIYKNGGNYARGNGGYLSNTSGDTEILATTLAYANGTTDYFEVYVYQNSGVSKTVYNDAGLTSFNGCMVRRA